MDVRIYDQLRNFAIPQFDILNKDQVTMLFEYVRIMYDASEKSLELLRKLVEDGADIYQPSQYYSRDTTPIDLLPEKKVEVLQALLETGSIDINRQDDTGNTLLHKVCAYNVNYDAEKAKDMYRKVKLLLENGADATITNDKDQTALDLASDDNLKIKTVELLMKQS
ncbi:ankyrin repeat domain-containing protein [Flavobacterium microcysteis]